MAHSLQALANWQKLTSGLVMHRAHFQMYGAGGPAYLFRSHLHPYAGCASLNCLNLVGRHLETASGLVGKLSWIAPSEQS